MPLFRRKTADRLVRAPAVSQSVPGSGPHRTSSNQSSRSLPHSPSTPDSWGDDNDMGLPYNILNGNLPGEKRPRTLLLTESVLQDGPDIPADSLESPLRTSSRLSKTLLEVIRDKDALSCFKSFMSSQKMEHLIQFWCDAESFHASTLTRLRTHSLQSISKSALHKRRSESLRHVSTDVSPSENALQPEPADRINRMCEPSQAVSQSSTENTKCQSSSNSVEECSHTSVYHAESIHAQSTDLSSPSIDLHQAQSKDESVSPKTPHLLPDDYIHRRSSEPCNIHINSPSEATENFVNTLSTSCDNPSSPPQPFVSGEFDLDSTGQWLSQAAAPPQSSPTDAAETTNLKSTSEISQEEIAKKLKKSIERDAVTIFSTYIAKDAPQPIGVDDSLRSEAISRICKEDGEVDPECFVSCQRFVLNRLDTEYFQSFRDSEFHCRHQVNMLTTEKVYLPDILLNENALCYFMEYMEQECASDLMQMWLAADNFQQQLTSTSGCYDGEQAQKDAMVIYDRYFSLQATNPIGFDDKLRFEIEGNICREGGPLPDCFTKAKNIVLKILEKVYFPNYLQGHIYYRYLSDLISTVQMSEDMPNKQFQKGHKRTESDASSEHSAGSQSISAESVVSRNTLLAVDTRKLRKGGIIEGDFSMNMDMFNPDDLWKRPDANSLSLGCVNELGQFMSKFEHGQDLDKKKGLLLFKRKKEKEKEEEEMALRIAQMIISDVNTMTKTGENMTSKPKS